MLIAGFLILHYAKNFKQRKVHASLANTKVGAIC